MIDDTRMKYFSSIQSCSHRGTIWNHPWSHHWQPPSQQWLLKSKSSTMSRDMPTQSNQQAMSSQAIQTSKPPTKPTPPSKKNTT